MHMAKKWYLQDTKFKFGLSKIRFHLLTKNFQLTFSSFTLQFVYKRFAPGVQTQHASMSLGMLTRLPAGFDYTSAPFPASHLKITTQGRTSSRCEGKSKQASQAAASHIHSVGSLVQGCHILPNKYFFFFCFISFTQVSDHNCCLQ